MLDKPYNGSKTPGVGQSGEDYLEAVLVIGREKQVVRVKDLAARLGVRRPSVVAALAHLERRGLVNHERYGGVDLTAAGARLAGDVYRRHRLLERFLREVLGVTATVASRDACRLEHALSAESTRRLLEFVDGSGIVRHRRDRCSGRTAAAGSRHA